MTALVVDRDMIADFIDALFRYADEGTYVQLRAFVDSSNGGTWGNCPAVKMNGVGPSELIDTAAHYAQRCANAAEPVVFCPPIVTLKNAITAAEKDVANGIALSVECDQAPSKARALLEFLLGPATIVVKSGGEWTCPVTGVVEAKLHLHWRLQEPTRAHDDHLLLKEARRLAQQLVGADGSAVPLVHPLRWPGSWHRKSTPRLTRVLALNEDAEIDLGKALELLREAVAARGEDASKADYTTHKSSEPEADPLDVVAALAVIPNADLPWDEWNRIGMASWRATGGNDAGFAMFAAWSAKSGKNYPAETRARWDHYPTSPPTLIGAGTLFYLAAEAQSGWRKPSDFVPPRSGDAFADYGNGYWPEGDAPRSAEEKVTGTAPLDPPAYTVQSWLDRDLPEPDLLLGPFSTTSRGMLVADTGIGKTNIAIAMAFAMAGGQPFLHWTGYRTARILFIDGEMSRRLLRARIRDAARRAGAVPENLYFLCRDDLPDMPPLNSRAGQRFIDAFIEQYGGVDFIYFDNIQALLLGDMKDEEPWQQTLPWIRDLTRRSIGQLWIHHTGHDTGRAYGTKTREWQLNSVMLAEKVAQAGADIAFSLKFNKARERTPDNRGDFDPVVVTLVDDIWTAEGGTRRGKPLSPLEQKFFLALQDALAAPGATIVNINGRPCATTEQWKYECIRLGLINSKKEPNKQRALFHSYRNKLIAKDRVACQADLTWII